MRIGIQVHGHLRDTSTVGNDEMRLTLPDSTGFRIRDLLETLNITEEEVQRVSINGRQVRLDANLRHRVKVEFFPRGHRTPSALPSHGES